MRVRKVIKGIAAALIVCLNLQLNIEPRQACASPAPIFVVMIEDSIYVFSTLAQAQAQVAVCHALGVPAVITGSVPAAGAGAGIVVCYIVLGTLVMIFMAEVGYIGYVYAWQIPMLQQQYIQMSMQMGMTQAQAQAEIDRYNQQVVNAGAGFGTQYWCNLTFGYGYGCP